MWELKKVQHPYRHILTMQKNRKGHFMISVLWIKDMRIPLKAIAILKITSSMPLKLNTQDYNELPWEITRKYVFTRRCDKEKMHRACMCWELSGMPTSTVCKGSCSNCRTSFPSIKFPLERKCQKLVSREKKAECSPKMKGIQAKALQDATAELKKRKDWLIYIREKGMFAKPACFNI